MTKAVFSGRDANNDLNLWMTDETSAGTRELTFGGSGGLSPFEITVLGSKALFESDDASIHSNLWVTDGTGVGTSELTATIAGESAIPAAS